MVRPILFYTRPLGWENMNSKLDVRYIPLCGLSPKRKNGKPSSDGHYAAATKEGIDQLISRLRKERPQYFLRWVNPGVSPKTMRAMREASPGTIFIVVDGNQPNRVSNYFIRFREFIDIPIINTRDSQIKNAYEREGFFRPFTLHEAIDPSRLPAAGTVRPDDIFFGGSNRTKWKGSNRVWEFPGGEFRYLLLHELNKVLRLRLRGNPKEWPFTCKPALADFEYLSEFERAKIALGCNQYELIRYYTRRTFHAGGSGAMFLTKYIPEMEKDFENRKHLVWFRTLEEGVELAKKYARDHEARERIAMIGRKWFLAKHSWEARLYELSLLLRD